MGISDPKANPNSKNMIRMAVRKCRSLYIRLKQGTAVIVQSCVNVMDSLHCAAFEAVTTSLVSLHVASNAESLATSLVRALEWLLTSMRVRMDAETRRS